jgi:hypothetical protein
MPQKSFATESGIILQQPVDVSDPVIIWFHYPRRTFLVCRAIWHRRPIDGRDRVRRGADRD